LNRLKLYLDNCCFNRPYDEPVNQFMSFEIESKLLIQEQIKKGYFNLVWSFILDFENEENPYEDIKESVKNWKKISKEFVQPEDVIRIKANELRKKYGFGAKDSLHISCALYSQCDYLLTTDKKMIKKGLSLNHIKILNPIQFVAQMEEENDQ